MASTVIDRIQKILNYNVSITNKANKNEKLPCYSNPEQMTGKNCIMLFYLNESDILQLGRTTPVGVYRTRIQVAARHNNYDLSRQAIYKAMEYLSANRSTASTFADFIGSFAPQYDGLDDTGGYVWSFETFIKGNK
jgi:hypothetical protein